MAIILWYLLEALLFIFILQCFRFKLETYLLVICLTFTSADKLTRKDKHGMLGEPPMLSNLILPADEWFTQILDHFDPTNEEEWQQVG